MGRWERSWAITRMSFDVLKKDSEMLAFPILSGIFSILFCVALIVPSFVLGVFESMGLSHDAAVPLQVAVLFVTYFGLSAIATFFNVCVVYTTRTRLEGGDATFGQSIGFAMSRLHLILGWSLLSASVGVLLHGIDSMARRSGLLGKILLTIVRAVLASAWAVMTVFVVPSMVYRGTGPIDAIKDSWATLKKTWGESIIGYYGVGIASFVCALPGLLLLGLGVFVAANVTPIGGVVLIGLGVFEVLAVSLVFGVVSTIYKTALYHWATTQTVPAGWDQAALQGAFL
jgi:hypothetical protein